MTKPDRITHLLQLESKATEGPWHKEKHCQYNVIGQNRRGIASFGGYSDTRQDVEAVHLESTANSELVIESRNSIKELCELLVEAEKALKSGNHNYKIGALDKINKFRKG